MKAGIDTIKITMSYDDVEELKNQIQAMIKDIEHQGEHLHGFFDEVKLREAYPKVNELLGVINVNNSLPF